MATEYSTKQFHHDASLKEFVSEASDLGFDSELHINLKSHVTGKVISFERQDCERDEDGDVQVWKYRITSQCAEANRALRGYTMVILND